MTSLSVLAIIMGVFMLGMYVFMFGVTGQFLDDNFEFETQTEIWIATVWPISLPVALIVWYHREVRG